MIEARLAAERTLAAPGFTAFRVVGLEPLTTSAALDRAALVYAADLACYPRPLQVSWAKLLYLCAGFPQGVRLYLGEFGGVWHPVGYAAWHPIAPGLLSSPWPAVVPISHLPTSAAYLYNYSVIPALVGSPTARSLMQALHREVEGIPVLVADTVSEHGRRAAIRWGMTLRERREREGAPWELWARG